MTTISGQVRLEGNNGPDDDINYQLRLQPSVFKPLASQSALLLRTIIPTYTKEWPTDDTGLGDITLAPYYVPDITQPTFFGFGGALGFPTATEDALGSKKFTGGRVVSCDGRVQKGAPSSLFTIRLQLAHEFAPLAVVCSTLFEPF